MRDWTCAARSVNSRSGKGAYLRQSPGETAILAVVPDGTVVQFTGRREEEAGLGQVEVVLPNGWVGWIAEEYLVPYQSYRAP